MSEEGSSWGKSFRAEEVIAIQYEGVYQNLLKVSWGGTALDFGVLGSGRVKGRGWGRGCTVS